MDRASRTPGAVPGREFLRRWLGYVALGEALGFTLPVAAGVTAARLGLSPWAAYAVAVVAGLGEGAVLGTAQGLALRRSGVGVPLGPWVRATSAAAGVAWAIGWLPSTLGGLDVSRPAILAAVVVGGLVLLLSIPTAQWPLLRPWVPRAWRWLPVNALAWALGLLWTFLPSPFIDESTPVALLGVAYGLAGLLMAVTVALVTGQGLRRMLA